MLASLQIGTPTAIETYKRMPNYTALKPIKNAPLLLINYKEYKIMTYLIRLSVDPDVLLQTYADGQGIEIKDVTEDIESILQSEINGWMDASGVYILELEEEKK